MFYEDIFGTNEVSDFLNADELGLGPEDLITEEEYLAYEVRRLEEVHDSEIAVDTDIELPF